MLADHLTTSALVLISTFLFFLGAVRLVSDLLESSDICMSLAVQQIATANQHVCVSTGATTAMLEKKPARPREVESAAASPPCTKMKD
jgi:hypothetical protein